MNEPIVVLAAGKGTRMHSRLPKVLHKVCGKPMLSYVVDVAKTSEDAEVIVVVPSSPPLTSCARYRVGEPGASTLTLISAVAL